MKTAALIASLTLVMSLADDTLALGAGVEVEDTGGRPSGRKTIITSPGVYKAEVWQAAGGGIMKFYDLAADPEAKLNLAGYDRGLFEVGWHGAGRKDADESKGDYISGKHQSYGCRDWPSMGHGKLKVEGELEVIEKSPARIRVRAKSVFTFWSRFADKNMPVTGIYTFYPTGKIAIQVRVQKREREFRWSGEYGPHLFLISNKTKDGKIVGFNHGTPRYPDYGKDTKGMWPRPAAEELSFAYSTTGIKTTFFITIPPEQHKVFSRHMRHYFPGHWDRFGYGSGGVLMSPGYDATWACMIQMGTPGSKLVPDIKTAKDAVPYAMQYREPAKLTGPDGIGITDDEGDLNKDGYNESEGCHVLKGPGPLSFTYEKGKGAGFAPVFKVTGWKGDAPKTVQVDGKETACVATVVDGKLIVQVMGTILGGKVQVDIGK